ncbi:aerotolerance regulator BatA [candidate division WOR-3 bacterium]|uniref:Aerotolerance regulator BatA n=1 Tax=candidate division WOR-3 bacterium TaxID=2052148 RepID=A0A660SIL9_UNCW3|nr:MAG: aerotolerance regulator BatA [candidate division WOR-3 bacterium]
MRFAHPIYLLFLAGIPLYYYLRMKTKPARILFSDTSFLTPNPLFHHGPLILNSIVILLFTLALARPQKGRVIEDVESEGIDIMLALDISGTMLAEDFRPKNRLHVAKEKAKEFVARRKGDRIGLVTFAGTAITNAPLTLNHQVIEDLIDKISFGDLPDGTAIGMGIATAVNRLKGSKAKGKVVILLTDGLNNAGEIDPRTAAELARSLGIKIYAIGIGSKGPVPYPVFDRFHRKIGYTRQIIDFDMAALREIGDLTNGQAFLATDPKGLEQIYQTIDRLEPTTFKVRRETVYQERCGLFLSLGIITLLATIILSATLFRRFP